MRNAKDKNKKPSGGLQGMKRKSLNARAAQFYRRTFRQGLAIFSESRKFARRREVPSCGPEPDLPSCSSSIERNFRVRGPLTIAIRRRILARGPRMRFFALRLGISRGFLSPILRRDR